MLPQHVLLALISACAAVPLNINLGAYSPALVVGDGEISLGSTESASQLMSTLASGAAAGGEGQQQQGQQQEGQRQEGEGQQQQEGEQQQQEGGNEGQGQGEGEQKQERSAEENAAKRALSPNLIRTIQHFGKRAPEANDRLAAVERAMEWIKRDLEGFNAALSYAREAQKDMPKVEMGTGEGGAGVGLVVNAGLNVPANSAANGQPAGGERRMKRSDVVAEESDAPKMTLVAITEV